MKFFARYISGDVLRMTFSLFGQIHFERGIVWSDVTAGAGLQ